MRKKLNILILTLAVSVLPTGCSKWLEATSSSQISSDKLFSSRGGFHEALSGIYMSMGSTSVYGMQYTWFATELSAGTFLEQNNRAFADFQNQRYATTFTQPVIESMWQGGYNVIANVNNMLDQLERRRDIITDPTEYALIKGELLAIRAYVHFDMLRIWGLPSWDGDNASKLTIPYVTAYQKEPTDQLSYQETLLLLEADIDSAIEYLEEDPIRGNVSESFDQAVNADGYWNNRNYHLNWYAARVLKARLLMWKGQFAEADAIAANVLDEVLQKEVATWVNPVEVLNAAGGSSEDNTFASEQIFTLDISNYYDTVSQYFFDYQNVNSNSLMLSPGIVQELYQSPYITSPTTLSLVGDIRGPAYLLKYQGSGYRTNKYYSTSSDYYRNRQPLIRLSELILMRTEAAIRNQDWNAACSFINTLHHYRGIDDEITPSNCLLVSQPLFFLWEEYQREFLAEGQLFYFRKRCQHELFSQALTVFTEEIKPVQLDLVFPYPQDETIYGHIQQR